MPIAVNNQVRKKMCWTWLNLPSGNFYLKRSPGHLDLKKTVPEQLRIYIVQLLMADLKSAVDYLLVYDNKI